MPKKQSYDSISYHTITIEDVLKNNPDLTRAFKAVKALNKEREQKLASDYAKASRLFSDSTHTK